MAVLRENQNQKLPVQVGFAHYSTTPKTTYIVPVSKLDTINSCLLFVLTVQVGITNIWKSGVTEAKNEMRKQKDNFLSYQDH